MRKAPEFWWQRRPDPRAILLSPAAAVWGLVARRRMEQPPAAKAPMPVICVGNPTVGGSGKTPMALALARLARQRGVAPGFLSRGYGGSEPGPLVVDQATHDARQVGDEALLLAAAAPTAIGADRGAAVGLLARAGVELAILDDGFQNPSLAKDLSFLVVDGAAGIGNGMVLPAGPLRAPVEVQLPRAEAVVIVGEGEAGAVVVRLAARAGKQVLRARLKPIGGEAFAGRRVLAFAGIGRPEKFFATLRALGADVAGIEFPDHQDYTPADAHYLLRRADSERLPLVTTAKDMARLRGTTGLVADLARRVNVLEIELEFAEPKRVEQMLDELMARARS